MARSERPDQGSLLRPGPRARSALRLGLHPLHAPGRHHRRRAVRPPDLPLRVDLLQLGDRHGLFRRELGESPRRFAECAMGTGWRPPTASDRPSDCCHPAGRRRPGIHPAIPGAAAPLRLARPGDQRRVGQRERRRRAESSTVQAGSRPGPLASRQPRLWRPSRLRSVRAAGVCPVERRPAAALGRGGATPASAAGTATGVMSALAGAGRFGQHHPCRQERLFGGQPIDR